MRDWIILTLYGKNFALRPEQQTALPWMLKQEGGICFSEREFVVVVDSNIVVDSNVVSVHSRYNTSHPFSCRHRHQLLEP